MAGSNQGASSAYTEAGPPEIIIALRRLWESVNDKVKTYSKTFTLTGQCNNNARKEKKHLWCMACASHAHLYPCSLRAKAGVSRGRISERTHSSRTRLSITLPYWAPASRIATAPSHDPFCSVLLISSWWHTKSGRETKTHKLLCLQCLRFVNAQCHFCTLVFTRWQELDISLTIWWCHKAAHPLYT